MRIELPEFKRCCCCIPLRRGLLFWVYLRLVVGVGLIIYFVEILARVLKRQIIGFSIVFSGAMILMVTDVVFYIVFIISAHMKKHKLMRMYYRYGVGALILEVIIMLAFIGLLIYTASTMTYGSFLIQEIVDFASVIFLEFVLHVYLIILVRSEVLKLARTQENTHK